MELLKTWAVVIGGWSLGSSEMNRHDVPNEELPMREEFNSFGRLNADPISTLRSKAFVPLVFAWIMSKAGPGPRKDSYVQGRQGCDGLILRQSTLRR